MNIMETINTTDTPRTDACPHCVAEIARTYTIGGQEVPQYICGSWSDSTREEVTDFCKEREARQKAEAEVERLTGRMQKAEDLIKGLHDGWKKARKAHLETCKNAQTEIEKLHTENICLQKLLQEFYEWTKRDYPTEAEVREIMDRYYNLLTK